MPQLKKKHTYAYLFFKFRKTDAQKQPIRVILGGFHDTPICPCPSSHVFPSGPHRSPWSKIQENTINVSAALTPLERSGGARWTSKRTGSCMLMVTQSWIFLLPDDPGPWQQTNKHPNIIMGKKSQENHRGKDPSISQHARWFKIRPLPRITSQVQVVEISHHHFMWTLAVTQQA